MFCVETNSFLPNVQSDGRDLARQGQPRQVRLHASGDAGLVKVLEGSCCRGSSRRCTLEDIFQIVIMVDVQAADGQNFLGAFELATNDAVFTAGVSPQCQSTVGPELSLGPEAVRGLHQRKQRNGADGADRGNLLQQSRIQMLPAFRQ